MEQSQKNKFLNTVDKKTVDKKQDFFITKASEIFSPANKTTKHLNRVYCCKCQTNPVPVWISSFRTIALRKQLLQYDHTGKL